jgi:hypothetical protein
MAFVSLFKPDQLVIATSHEDSLAILGAPFFTSFYVSLDRDNGRIGISAGCNCESSSYRSKVIIGDAVYSSAKKLRRFLGFWIMFALY